MYQISIKEGGHDWHKTNLITISTKHGGYDKYTCNGCGIKGESHKLGIIYIDGRLSRAQVMHCRAFDSSKIPTRIKITFCQAQGGHFKNLIPGSEHDVVTPPGEYKNDSSGVWVMGVGEPVKVLKDEFEKIA